MRLLTEKTNAFKSNTEDSEISDTDCIIDIDLDPDEITNLKDKNNHITNYSQGFPIDDLLPELLRKITLQMPYENHFYKENLLPLRYTSKKLNQLVENFPEGELARQATNLEYWAVTKANIVFGLTLLCGTFSFGVAALPLLMGICISNCNANGCCEAGNGCCTSKGCCARCCGSCCCCCRSPMLDDGQNKGCALYNKYVSFNENQIEANLIRNRLKHPIMFFELKEMDSTIEELNPVAELQPGLY